VRDRTREFLGPATTAFAFIRETPYDVSLLPTVRGPEPSGGAPAAPALPAPPPVIARPGPPTASSAPVTNVPLPELKVDGVVRLMSIGEAVAVIVDADRRLEAMVRETQPSVSTAALVAAGAAVATLSADAESRLETINFILSNVTARVAGATELFRRAEEAAGRVRELVESTRKDREAAARTANAEEAARAVEEAARNTERLLAEKADAEKTQASALRAECLELVLAYRFHDAHKRARNAMGPAETDAGRQAFRVLTDRYQLLSELKQFIVEQLNTDPRPWIWGSGTTAEDVMGADDNTIRVRTGPMSWNDVTVAQMLKFINIYVATSNQKVKLRTQCRMALAAAVYCLEHGGQSAVAAARTYANRAVGLCPDTSREVERLLDFGSESL
jgi:putative hemolysin